MFNCIYYILYYTLLLFQSSSSLLLSSLLPNQLIQSIRVGTYISLFIFIWCSRTIRPRMFYRSGWLRCVGLKYVVFVFRAGVTYDIIYYTYYILYYTIIYYTYTIIYLILLYYYILYYTLLLFWSILLILPFLSSSPLFFCSPLLFFTSIFQSSDPHFILYVSVLTYPYLYSSLLFLLSFKVYVSVLTYPYLYSII